MQDIANLIGLSIFTLSLAAGQVLFKYVSMEIKGEPMPAGFLTLLYQPAFYGALITYAFSTLLWIWILTRVPLSRAYPWSAAGMIIVPLLSYKLFEEKMGGLYWLGAALVVAGLIITQISNRSG